MGRLDTSICTRIYWLTSWKVLWREEEKERIIYFKSLLTIVLANNVKIAWINRSSGKNGEIGNFLRYESFLVNILVCSVDGRRRAYSIGHLCC